MRVLVVLVLIVLTPIAVAQVQDQPTGLQSTPSRSWEKEPSDFRGVPWGISESELKKKIAKLSCFEFKGARSCAGDFNIAEIKVRNFFKFHEDKLVIVFFMLEPKDFPFIKDVFVEKYGEPTKSSVTPVKNRMGAEFMNESLVWDGANSVLELEKYSSKVTEGMASFTVKSYLESKLKEEEAVKKKAVDDF